MSMTQTELLPASAALSGKDLYAHIENSIEHHKRALGTVCRKIHENPELNYREFQAHDNICDLMEDLGYSVTRHAHGIETSFQVEFGKGGSLVVFNAEYDALPGLGHACGHNLIATSSIAAFIAVAEALRTSGISGRIRLLGTPAEEGGGGKIRLINAGAYKEVDACLMGHPMGCYSSPHKKIVDGIAAGKSTARRQVEVTFRGSTAHAAQNPWNGTNALDAVVASYVNISLLRQQLPSTARVHGVIRDGGAEPNIIPDSARLEYFVRDTSAARVQNSSQKVEACFKAGALATGCTVECNWKSDNDYMDLRPNMTISREFTQHMKAFNRNYLEDNRQSSIGASTDMGNVSYQLPGFHSAFSIGTDDPKVQPHTPMFAVAAGTKEALEAALDNGKGMAVTAYKLLTDPKLLLEAWNEFKDGVVP